jgi:hypothetical protein
LAMQKIFAMAVALELVAGFMRAHQSD